MLRIFMAATLAVGLGLAPAVIGTARAQTTAPAPKADKTTPAPKTEKTKTAKPLSPAQQAMHERQKKCGAEWKAAKAAGKTEKGMTWPKYWSNCNKRLKAGG